MGHSASFPKRMVSPTMRPILFTTVVLAFVVGTGGEEADDDCTPMIAERCFNNFWGDTLFSGKTESEICSAVYDDILCSQDIIDDGCRIPDGRDNFDSWMRGINAVYSFFCLDQHLTSLHELLQNIEPRGSCFNLTSFVSCIERKSKVTHITDMLYVTMDAVECNWILISFATCGSRVSPGIDCVHVQEIITEALHIFFQKAGCAYICSTACSLHPLVYTLLIIAVIAAFNE